MSNLIKKGADGMVPKDIADMTLRELMVFKTTGINTLFLFSRTDICANCNSKLRDTLSENFSSIIAKTTSALSIFRFRATLIFEPISFIDGFEIIFAFLMLLKSFSANEILSSEAKI